MGSHFIQARGLDAVKKWCRPTRFTACSPAPAEMRTHGRFPRLFFC
jgi:hypothetical protein